MIKDKVTEVVIVNNKNVYIGKITIYDILNSKVDKQKEIKRAVK